MGADEIVFHKQSKGADAVRKRTGGDGVDVVIDPVGGTAFGDNAQGLRPRGTIVNFGLSCGIEGTIPHLCQFFRNELRILGSWTGSMHELRFGLSMVRQGLIKAAIDKVLPLSAARDVHRMIEDHAIAGMVAMLPWS